MTVLKTSSTGLRMNCVSVIKAMCPPVTRRVSFSLPAVERGIAAAKSLAHGRSGGRLPRFAPPAMRCRPLLVRRDLLAHDIEEVVSTCITEKPELALQIGDGGIEAAVRAEIPAEAAVLGIELDQRLRVVDRPLELRAVPDYAWISHQCIDVRRIEVRDDMRVEPGKRLSNALPLRIDHTPADSALEDRARDRLQVPGELTRSRTPGCIARGHLDLTPAAARTSPRTGGHRRTPASTRSCRLAPHTTPRRRPSGSAPYAGRR